MKSAQGLTGIWISGIVSSAAVLIGAQPTFAAARVTAVQLNPTAAGVNILLQTKGSDRPQVFSVNRGKSWTADIVNTQLQIPGGTFRQTNPTAGIALIEVIPLDRNSVRVIVTGQTAAPVGQVSRDNGSLLFSLSRSNGKQAKNPAPVAAKPSAQAIPLRSQKPASLPPVPSVAAKPAPAPAARASLPVVQPSATPATRTPVAVPPNQSPIAQNVPSSIPPFKGGTPLVQNPEIKIEGGPQAPIPTPPLAPNPLPRAVAPPVGDIAVGQIDASPSFIDLATAERVPRLVLRDASSREVLSLLARSAGLNIVFTADQAGPPGQQQQQQQQQQQPGQAPLSDGPRVTLDIENEPVQNVFNYVLQIAGLEANRRGNTVFVGPRLPNSARNLVTRSLRINQIFPITNAVNFLVALGAESAVSRERQVVSAVAIPVTQIQGAAQATPPIQSLTTTETRVETQRVNFVDSTPILRGLQVVGDERTNTVTLTGEARKVDIAISMLTQIDVRRRQVAVNVRVIDVDLRALDALGTSFSFGVGDTRVVSEGGIGLVNIGRRAPTSTGISVDLTNNTVGDGIASNLFSNNVVNFAKGFFLQLQAAVTNGNAKILADPTLVIQESQTAQVRLTQEVVTNIRQVVTQVGTGANAIPQATLEVEKAAAGLILPVKVDRIDDNGFILLSVAPSIARPDAQFGINIGGNINTITLLNERRVESGQFRIRDGQTLVLAGIIQDEDRSEVTKIPILGDIPILGALFRRTSRSNQRREVIVIVTPRILDDSDRSAFGYSYTPGPEINKVLERNR